MKKKTVVDKLAKNAFDSAPFQKSWSVHMQAFGPILEPAFVEDYQSRVHLVAALNDISNRKIAQGFSKLKELQDACVTDADRAAFLFFMGVCNEMDGNREQMLSFYTHANEYGHRFYLPYLKVAKFWLDGRLYDRAEENFRSAINCFSVDELDGRDRLILASAYANLASCLLMMHRYDEAEEAISASRSLYPNMPGRVATEAAFYAVRGDVTKVEASLAALKVHVPNVYDAVKKSTDKILAHTDPLFFAVPVDEEKITEFWNWFAGYEAELAEKLEREECESARRTVSFQLLSTFPFLEEPPYVSLEQTETGYVLELKDMFAIGIIDAYERLLQACPEDIRSRWQFVVVH